MESMARHLPARRWLEALLNGDHPIGLPWAVLVGFVRVTTSRRIFDNPITPSDALAATDKWIASPIVQIIEPGTQHYAIFRRLVESTPGGNIATDAHLAALAIEHDAELHSNDGDFARFSGLRWVNPLT
jgi:toxin-antitoxin system PIN domain toxin